LFFSDDLGQIWRKKAFQEGNYLVSSLMIGKDIYIGGRLEINNVTDSTVIYKSTDGGTSWSNFYYGSGQDAVIMMCKDDQNRLYAGTDYNFFIYTEESLSKSVDQHSPPLSLYPNTTSNLLNINNATNIQTVFIFDITGQQVLSFIPSQDDSKEILNFDISSAISRKIIK